MIKTLDELVCYSINLSEECPEDRDRLDLRSPLPSASEFSKLQQLDELPKSYLDVTERVALLGKEIGFFLLWPEAFGRTSLADALRDANSSASPYVAGFRMQKAYHIASFEAEPIGVIKVGELSEGVIIKLDIGKPDHPSAMLAENFTQFLLIAGSLDQAQAATGGGRAFENFMLDLEGSFDPKIVDAWKPIGEIAFGC